MEKELSLMNQRIKGEIIKFNEKKQQDLKKVLLRLLLVYKELNTSV